MEVEYCIDEINEMLFAAYAHGGDGAGSYYSEPTWMKEAVNSFLARTRLDKDFVYQETEKVLDDGQYKVRYIDVPQIIKKPNSEKLSYGWE